MCYRELLTSGLHFIDIKKLLNVIQKLADHGNTIIIIEHNTDVIENSDWVVDLGPDGGIEGGNLIAQCTPVELTRVKNSYTGKYLKK